MSSQIAIVKTDKAPRAIGPYSQATILRDLVFCSGQIPLDPDTGSIVGNTVAEQTHRVLCNLRAVLEASGSSLDNVLKTTVFITDMSKFSELNEVYAEYFRNNPPARSAVQVGALPKGVLVEIEAIAYRL